MGWTDQKSYRDALQIIKYDVNLHKTSLFIRHKTHINLQEAESDKQDLIRGYQLWDNCIHCHI